MGELGGIALIAGGGGPNARFPKPPPAPAQSDFGAIPGDLRYNSKRHTYREAPPRRQKETPVDLRNVRRRILHRPLPPIHREEIPGELRAAVVAVGWAGRPNIGAL